MAAPFASVIIPENRISVPTLCAISGDKSAMLITMTIMKMTTVVIMTSLGDWGAGVKDGGGRLVTRITPGRFAKHWVVKFEYAKESGYISDWRSFQSKGHA